MGMRIHRVMTRTADAMERKEAGNKYFKNKEFARAIEAYAAARETLTKASVSGHHVAALWCNEANCWHQLGNVEKAREACDAGLKIETKQQKIEDKLKYNSAKCDEQPEAKESEKASPVKEPMEEPEPQLRAAAARSNMNKGFFHDNKAGLGYGPEGSHNGAMPQYYQQPINGGEAVINVPINQPNCAKINLIDCGDLMEKKDSDDEEEGESKPKEITEERKAELAKMIGVGT